MAPPCFVVRASLRAIYKVHSRTAHSSRVFATTTDCRLRRGEAFLWGESSQFVCGNWKGNSKWAYNERRESKGKLLLLSRASRDFLKCVKAGIISWKAHRRKKVDKRTTPKKGLDEDPDLLDDSCREEGLEKKMASDRAFDGCSCLGSDATLAETKSKSP